MISLARSRKRISFRVEYVRCREIDTEPAPLADLDRHVGPTRAKTGFSISGRRQAKIVSAPSGSTCTISASMPVAFAATEIFSGRMPKMTFWFGGSGGMRSGGSANDQAPTRMLRPPEASVTTACMRFIGGLPKKACHEGVGRPAVDFERLPDLHHPAAVHDADARPHGHRLDLVVRDIDHRGAEPSMQRRDLAARRHAQRRIEIGQRLVEQEHFWIAHDRAPQRHALALLRRTAHAACGRAGSRARAWWLRR